MKIDIVKMTEIIEEAHKIIKDVKAGFTHVTASNLGEAISPLCHFIAVTVDVVRA